MLVSITIAGTAFVVLMSGFGTNMKNIGIAEDYTTAAFLAKQVLVELETGQPQPGRTEGEFGEDYDRFRWVAEVEKDSAKSFYKVNVKVIFVRGVVDRELEIKTVFLAPEMKEQKELQGG